MGLGRRVALETEIVESKRAEGGGFEVISLGYPSSPPSEYEWGYRLATKKEIKAFYRFPSAPGSCFRKIFNILFLPGTTGPSYVPLENRKSTASATPFP